MYQTQSYPKNRKGYGYAESTFGYTKDQFDDRYEPDYEDSTG